RLLLGRLPSSCWRWHTPLAIRVGFLLFQSVLLFSTHARPYQPITGSSPTNLQFCTGLRRLELVFHHSSDIPAALLRVRTLPHLRSSHLVTVHVTDNYGSNDQESWRWSTMRWPTSALFSCVRSRSKPCEANLSVGTSLTPCPHPKPAGFFAWWPC
ncbi:hypothetical protein FB451DRAFT_1263741, partial [Mycena latifolia]